MAFMTDDVVVCVVLSARIRSCCLAFRDRINSFPLFHPAQLAYIFSLYTCIYDLHPNNDCSSSSSSSSSSFYFISFDLRHTKEVWSLTIVSPGPCRSLFIPGSIFCATKLSYIIDPLQGGLLCFHLKSCQGLVYFCCCHNWHTQIKIKEGEWIK